MAFNASRSYNAKEELRGTFYEMLAAELLDNWPHGVCWVLIAARRRGKTWSLSRSKSRV
jgi:hypothetical protein